MWLPARIEGILAPGGARSETDILVVSPDDFDTLHFWTRAEGEGVVDQNLYRPVPGPCQDQDTWLASASYDGRLHLQVSCNAP